MLLRSLLALIRLYQRLLSPLLGNVCRFEPSCSRYAAACLEAHGVVRGGLLSVKRLCKCHPFHPGGFDPPPAPLPSRSFAREPRRSGAPELPRFFGEEQRVAGPERQAK